MSKKVERMTWVGTFGYGIRLPKTRDSKGRFCRKVPILSITVNS